MTSTESSSIVESSLVELVTCETAEQLFSYLDPTNKSIWGGNRVPEWVFRGQEKAEWPLLPHAWRSKAKRNPDWRLQSSIALKDARRWLSKKFEEGKHSDILVPSKLPKPFNVPFPRYRLRRLLVQARWEQLLCDRFIELADEIGVRIAGAEGPLMRTEFQLIDEEGATEAPTLVETFAQHHGVPTRLMDWTRRPYIAAYFAAEKRVRPLCKQPSDDDAIVVWALNVHALNHLAGPFRRSQTLRKLKLGLQHLSSIRAGHSYLHAQDGLFTWICGWERYFMDHGRFPDLVTAAESAAEESEYDGQKPFRKISLPAANARELLKLLERHRITKCTLMPSLDNVVDTIRIQSRTLPNARDLWAR